MAVDRFTDRREAGRALAERLAALDLIDPVVLALPRGGVPIGREVADRLDAPLEVFVTRKIGAPHQPELAIGAVAEGGTVLIDDNTAAQLGLNDDVMAELTRRVEYDVEERVAHYRGARRLPSLHGRTAIIVDDGLATGFTAEAAVRAVRALRPAHIVMAAPVCSTQAAQFLATIADAVEFVICPPRLGAVGNWYADFRQVADADVRALLDAPPS